MSTGDSGERDVGSCATDDNGCVIGDADGCKTRPDHTISFSNLQLTAS